MDVSLLVRKMLERGYRIATAESCTGGMVAAAIVGVPDASKVLDACFVTYANTAKLRYAHVSQESIVAYGVVSEQVAGEMAIGIARETGASIGVSTSGIAGPTGGTTETPVGTVCMGIYIDNEVTTFREVFHDMDRNQVREAATDYVLTKLYEILERKE